MVQTVRKHVKALMLATETFLKTKIKDDSAFLNGFPRNAAWLCNRCRVRADTAHEKTPPASVRTLLSRLVRQSCAGR